MRHWTPVEMQSKLQQEFKQQGQSWGKVAALMRSDARNLYEAAKGRRAMPRAAARYLGFRRVTAYVKGR